MQMSLWVFYAARFDSEIRMSPGQRPAVNELWPESALHLHFVSVSCFWALYFPVFWAKRNSNMPHATDGPNWTARPFYPLSLLTFILCLATHRHTDTHPSCATYNGLYWTPHIINTFNGALVHYKHTRTHIHIRMEGLINMETHLHLFCHMWVDKHSPKMRLEFLMFIWCKVPFLLLVSNFQGGI